MPRLTVLADRRQVLVRDQVEKPAADVRGSVGQAECRSDSHGLVRLDAPLEEGANLRVEGLRLQSTPEAL